jgi:hypothetical protein
MSRAKTKKRAAKTAKRKKFLFIPFPLVIFILLCTGVYLAAWTFNAHADDIIVNAIVKGKPINSPAVITSPSEGAHFSAVPITVTGSCPAEAAYVEIFRNGFMSGSAICSSGGTFEILTDLFIGANKLEIHSFNVTDDEGPVSAAVNVVYTPPHPSQPGLQTGSSSPGGQTSPLQLKTAFIYKGYYVGQEVQWPLEISGGTAPYALNVDWGDGQSSIISRQAAGQFFIKHTYKVPGGFHGNFKIKVQASDVDGGYTYLQFFVIVNPKTAANIGSIYSKGPPTLGGLHDWVWAAWPAYAAVVLMVISFKLGEGEEFRVLRKRHQIRGS